MIAADDEFARFLSWDGTNYIINQCDGRYGAITFHEGMAVGTSLTSTVSIARIMAQLLNTIWLRSLSVFQPHIAAARM